MFNDEIVNKNSLLYKFDPRLKIIILFLFSIFVAVFKSVPVLFIAFFISITAVFISAIPFSETIKRLVPVNLMIIFLWFFLPFTSGGEVLYSKGIFAITKEGLILASTITIKANTMMLFFVAFVASTPVNTTGQAMSQLGIPDKLVHLFFFTYRYIYVIYESYVKLKKAMLIRGFVPATNFHTYRSYAYLIGMLLVKSSDRAKRVHDAMLCRGFTGKFYSLTNFSINSSDLAVFIIMLLLIVFMGILEWMPLSLLLN